LNPLDILRSSGGTDVEIPTIELRSSAWADSLFLCAGFFDQVFELEDGRVITFQASGLDATLPKKDNQGSQVLGVAIDNVRGEAQRRLDAAKAAGVEVLMTYRVYLESDPTAPAERPMDMEVLSFSAKGPTVELQGGYFNLIASAWPRFRYTTDFSPGIKYLT
jgi:Domain of unknown function (DUF1833).